MNLPKSLVCSVWSWNIWLVPHWFVPQGRRGHSCVSHLAPQNFKIVRNRVFPPLLADNLCNPHPQQQFCHQQAQQRFSYPPIISLDPFPTSYSWSCCISADFSSASSPGAPRGAGPSLPLVSLLLLNPGSIRHYNLLINQKLEYIVCCFALTTLVLHSYSCTEPADLMIF